MSTRSQCFIKQTGVFLYQHHDGYDLMDTVVNAVNSNVGQSCQDDPEYLTQIICCAMVKGREDVPYGYGIGTTEHSDINYLVTVDLEKKTIIEEKIKMNIKEILRKENFKNN